MMEQTVTALRRFVNDEINELHFAVRGVAAPYLKPGSGTFYLKVVSNHFTVTKSTRRSKSNTYNGREVES